jgi:hypothetical protein
MFHSNKPEQPGSIAIQSVSLDDLKNIVKNG